VRSRAGNVRLDRFGVKAGEIRIDAGSWLNSFYDDPSNHQRQRSHHLEVNECLEANAAHALEVAHAGDTRYDGSEDDRRHNHPDELDEGVAERLQLNPEIRKEIPEACPKDDRQQDLKVEVAENGFVQHGSARSTIESLGRARNSARTAIDWSQSKGGAHWRPQFRPGSTGGDDRCWACSLLAVVAEAIELISAGGVFAQRICAAI